MTDTKLWKIIILETTGWNEIEEPNCVKLSKEQCTEVQASGTALR